MLAIVGILKEVVAKCVDGASVISICEFGDARLLEETARVFKKDKEMKKGKPYSGASQFLLGNGSRPFDLTSYRTFD